MSWEFYGNNENLQVFDPPHKSPKNCDNLYNSKLQPQMITSELLRKVCKNTHSKILRVLAKF